MKKLFIPLLLLLAAPAAAKVRLPAVFGDNMVLQQHEAVLWGTSDAQQVTIRTSWSDQPLLVAVDEGHWRAVLRTPAGSFTAHTITLRDADSELSLQNVLVGEVWICSGQSNMAMPLRGYTGQPVDEALSTALQSPRYADRIRMVTLPRRDAAVPQCDFEGRWEVPDPQSTLRMSAAAYFFARTLSDALDLPVGIVSASWGGSKIEAWMDPASLRRLGYDVETINADPERQPRTKCGLLYNGLIAPVAGLAARGFVWYQGESNRKEAALYARLMEELAAFWRTRWGDTEARMPFIWVQIAPHAYGDARALDAALLREAQDDALARIPNAAMVATTDLGDEHCIHPARKRPVGERIAAEALALAYRMPIPDASAVRFESAEFSAGKAVVTFSNARYGLAPRDEAITGFELAGSDGVFHPATGRIVPSQPRVEVTSPAVAQPVAVRYAFRNYTPANLRNTLGLPAFPFRSDR